MINQNFQSLQRTWSIQSKCFNPLLHQGFTVLPVWPRNVYSYFPLPNREKLLQPLVLIHRVISPVWKVYLLVLICSFSADSSITGKINNKNVHIWMKPIFHKTHFKKQVTKLLTFKSTYLHSNTHLPMFLGCTCVFQV